MKQALLRWIVLSVAVWIAASIVPGISCDPQWHLLIAALVLGVLNSSVKPIIQMISLPFIIVSLGFFLLVINALLLGLTSWLVPGFHVSGFWPAVGGSLVISVVSMFLGYSNAPRRRIVVDRTMRSESEYTGERRPPPGKGPIIDV